MDRKLRIGFVWKGITDRKDQWRDGLWAAMKIVEKTYNVSYLEPSDTLDGYDLLLYWEAPCTINGKNKDDWLRVVNTPTKKMLLFAGGPIKREWIEKFDHIFVESQINYDEVKAMGIPVSTAFGINDEIFHYVPYSKVWDGVHHGTCASWKRQWLVGEALGMRGLVFGRPQETDPRPFDECRKRHVVVLDEQSAERTAELLNSSRVFVQTSDFWGGGQRATLEAMACGLPVIVMNDSPKNREFVEGIDGNKVVDPSSDQIRDAVNELIDLCPVQANIDYVKNRWTAQHYADALLNIINEI